MHLGLSAVNVTNEFNTFGTPVAKVIIPTNGYHWSAPGHVFENLQRLESAGQGQIKTIAIKLILS